MFSLTLQPVQTFLTLTAKVSDRKTDVSLSLNKEDIKSQRATSSGPKPESPQEKVEQGKDLSEPEKFDIRLNEGLNYAELKCQNTASEKRELMRFWINVLP